MAQNQKSYDNEFKAQAVKLAQEIGGHKAAQELGIPKGTMYILDVRLPKEIQICSRPKGRLIRSVRPSNSLSKRNKLQKDILTGGLQYSIKISVRIVPTSRARINAQTLPIISISRTFRNKTLNRKYAKLMTMLKVRHLLDSPKPLRIAKPAV